MSALTKHDYEARLRNAEEEIAKMRQERDELAAQVEVMREALTAQRDLDYTLRGEVTGPQLERVTELQENALSIAPSAALREVQARTLEEAALLKMNEEEVKRLAVGSGFEPEAVAQHATQIAAFDSVCDFARAIYQLGRQHQRESDAALREKLANDAYDFERPNAKLRGRAL